MTFRHLSPAEASLAGILHDIGKLAQRAHRTDAELTRAYAEAGRSLDGTKSAILPLRPDGRYSHIHALWSDYFFLQARSRGWTWPDGVDAAKLEAASVRHHAPRPDDPDDWMIAEADRLASGLERKQKDEEAELGQHLRETELVALPPEIRLSDQHAASRLWYPAFPLRPETILPRPATPHNQPGNLEHLWGAWLAGFDKLARQPSSSERFEQGLLNLSERMLWSVPSSTVDQPDISLHDHAAAVAAIAATLAAWHSANQAWEVAAVRDRDTPKFRLLVLDLSGIQNALFRLEGQKSAAKILRARSFLMSATVSSALLGLRSRLGLPASSVMLNAGGKAELLAPDLPDFDKRLDEVRAELDRWMIEAWQGDLALILAAGTAFPARAFEQRGAGLPQVREELAAALDTAKARPLSFWRSASGQLGTGIIAAPFDADGPCDACGTRPATSHHDDGKFCRICAAAREIGQSLPRATAFCLVAGDPADAIDALPPPARLKLRPDTGREALASYHLAEDYLASGNSVFRARPHVPVFENPDDERYRALVTDGHLAALALEHNEKNGFRGQAMLAVMKADVDRLGHVFARGLGKDKSPARVAQLSRLLDAYFTDRLPYLLRKEFSTTYTVYAGGDDLLLVLPWRFALPLSLRLRQDFSAFAGGNQDLTLSAGLAFIQPHHPLALAVREAEEALTLAKDAGRNRLGLFDRALDWGKAHATQDLSEDLCETMLRGILPPSFLYRVRVFTEMRARAESGDSAQAGWNAKFQYHQARLLQRASAESRDCIKKLLERCLPAPGEIDKADAEIAITMALWRVR